MQSRQTFLIEGLDCPSCAAKVERRLAELNGVSEAKVDYLGGKIQLQAEESAVSGLFETVKNAVRDVEPGVKISDTKAAKPNEKDKGRWHLDDAARLIVGGLLFAAGFAAEKLGAPLAATGVLFGLCVLITGGDVFYKAARNIVRLEVFDETLLMSIATVGAFSIGSFGEGAAVMFLYSLGEWLQELAAGRSKRSIKALLELRPDYANLTTPDGLRRVDPKDVRPGELIAILPGEKVPLDSLVVEGRTFVDTAGLTGEPVPRSAAPGDTVLAGYINRDGMITARVQKAFGESTVARVIDMMENASSHKARAENFITKFARWYTPFVTGAALLLAVIPPLAFAQPFFPWLYRAMVFLVVSCPCALVISVPLGFFAGIGAASFNGVLVRGGNYLEALGHLDTVVFDKTGTLTKGVFEVTRLQPAPGSGITEQELLRTAATAETLSRHPIAVSIVAAAGENAPAQQDVRDFHELAGYGVTAVYDGHSIAAGNEKLMRQQGLSPAEAGDAGTVVHVARDGVYLGCLVISDIIRSDAASTVSGLRALGVSRFAMLTGDSRAAAEHVAKQAGISRVEAGLLPGQKVEAFRSIAQGTRGTTAFVGDGINDAPVLAGADIGIAMGGAGSDAAVEAADIVVMNDEPSRVVTAVKIARYVRRIVGLNIVLALVVKFAVLILGALGLATIWEAVFADTGVMLLAVLNSMRVLVFRKRFASVPAAAQPGAESDAA